MRFQGLCLWPCVSQCHIPPSVWGLVYLSSNMVYWLYWALYLCSPQWVPEFCHGPTSLFPWVMESLLPCPSAEILVSQSMSSLWRSLCYLDFRLLPLMSFSSIGASIECGQFFLITSHNPISFDVYSCMPRSLGNPWINFSFCLNFQATALLLFLDHRDCDRETENVVWAQFCFKHGVFKDYLLGFSFYYSICFFHPEASEWFQMFPVRVWLGWRPRVVQSIHGHVYNLVSFSCTVAQSLSISSLITQVEVNRKLRPWLYQAPLSEWEDDNGPVNFPCLSLCMQNEVKTGCYVS